VLTELTKIIVIGGEGVGYLSSVEAIDLADDDKRCPSIPDYPIALDFHTAAYYQGKVVSCGGYDGGRYDKCYELGPDLRGWLEFLPFPNNQESDMKSSVIDDKWIISGGDVSSSSLLVFDGRFTIDPPMPYDKNNHCQLTLNSTHIFFTAGEGSDPIATFMLDYPRGEWIYLDYIPSSSMVEPACGFVKDPSFGQEVIVASDTRSFIFSLTDLEWREGPVLPENLDFLTSVQLNNGFLAIGGFDRNDLEVDTIYRFDPNSYDWVLEKERLAVPRRFAAAVAVPDEFLACE